MERTRVHRCGARGAALHGTQAPIELHPEMPTGPLNRVADNCAGPAAARLGAAGEVHGRPAPHRSTGTSARRIASRARPDSSDQADANADRSLVHIAFFNRSFYPGHHGDRSAADRSLRGSRPGSRLSRVGGRAARRLPPSTQAARRDRVALGRERCAASRCSARAGRAFDKRRFTGRATNYMTYFASACWPASGSTSPDRGRRAHRSADHRPGGVAGRQAVRRAARDVVPRLFPEVTVLLEDFHSDDDQRRRCSG